jgi:two-component system phosphate regulon response regulator PhoB
MSDSIRRHRVLVVEDEDNIALAIEYIVTREGWSHDRIANGGEAVRRIRETRPDVVLLDVMLPEVSGYEICRQVREDPTLSAVRILMMTARGSAVERAKGLQHGADDLVLKPFDMKDLQASIRRLLPQEV